MKIITNAVVKFKRKACLNIYSNIFGEDATITKQKAASS
jgi:hypothetical protein